MMIKIIEFIIFVVLLSLLSVTFICICHRIYEDWKEERDINRIYKKWKEEKINDKDIDSKRCS